MSTTGTPPTGPSTHSGFLSSRLSALSFTALCWIQGVYFLVTGLWLIFSMDSFEQVTGPKLEPWGVKPGGPLIIVVAVVLREAPIRRGVVREVGLLAAASCVVRGAVDVPYAARGVIPPIYLADAL